MKPKSNNLNPQALANQKKVLEKKQMETDRIKNKIDIMSTDEVVAELKKNKLDSYGNPEIRLKRLKNQQGIDDSSTNANQNKKSTVDKIKEIEERRKARREGMLNKYNDREEKRIINAELGQQGDVDFYIKIEKFKNYVRNNYKARPYNQKDSKIQVVVRKRPIFESEKLEGNIDCITTLNPICLIHETKLKIDGISKVLDNQFFCFDHSFGEDNTSEEIQKAALKPLVPHYFNGNNATVFAQGQTGSGKTQTMAGMIDTLAAHIFDLNAKYNYTVIVSFFEIYLAKLLDLLNGRERLRVLEDSKGQMTISGLVEKKATSAEELVNIINFAFQERTTHSTVSNEVSSRSHAICEIKLQTDLTSKSPQSKISIVDLAGSERGNETKSNDSNRRTEGAKINVSLLALKECIRSIANRESHVPQRTDTLTKVLRDSFVSKKGKDNRIVMIACVSPCNSHSDHSNNTLRYADRLNEREKINPGFDLNYDVDESTQEVKITPRQYAMEKKANDCQTARDNDEINNLNNKKDDRVKNIAKKENYGQGDKENNVNDIKRDKAIAKAKATAEDLNRKKLENKISNNKENKENKENIHVKNHEQMNDDINEFEKNKNNVKIYNQHHLYKQSDINSEHVAELKISQSEVDINKLTEHDDSLSSSESGSLNEDRDKSEYASQSDQVEQHDHDRYQDIHLNPDGNANGHHFKEGKHSSGKKSNKSIQERDLEQTLINEQGEIPDQLKKQYKNVDNLYSTEEKLLDLHQSQMKREADLIIEENDLYEAKNSENIELCEYLESLEKILELKEEMNKDISAKISQCKKLLNKEQNMSNHIK